jgi:formate dehydrogenase major subunit
MTPNRYHRSLPTRTNSQTEPLLPRYDSGMRSATNGSGQWPLWKQVKNRDWEGLGEIASSPRTESLAPRTSTADQAVASVCPYCAVGCGQLVYVKNGKILDIEGDPRSPISNGCLCPKGAATFQLVTGAHRVHRVLYRRPYGTEWEQIPLEQAMDMVADRVRKTRESHWEQTSDDGCATRRTMSMAHLGGATLDNEENYLIKKLFTSLGIVQIENQARI